MDHKSDIEEDISLGRIESLQDTFDHLVAWNGGSEMDGLESAEDLMALFKSVCEALRSSSAITPHETVQHLVPRMGVEVDNGVSTYGGAARFALVHARTWWPAFSANFPHPAG